MISYISILYKKNQAACCVLVILFFGLISVTWFKGNNLFSGTDSYFPLERSVSMKNTFFAWDDRSFGSATASTAFILPYGLILMLSEYFNLSLPITQKIWFYFLFSGSGLSMFFFVSVVTKYTKGSVHYPIATFSSLFFMFNPYVGVMATSYSYLWLTYSFLPLKLGMYMKGLIAKSNFRYVILFVFIWIITSASQYTNPKYLIIDLLPIFLFFIYYLFFIASNKKEKIKAIKFSLFFLFLLLLMCVYWLLPASMFISEAFVNSQKAYASINLSRSNAFLLNSANSITDAMRMLGLWALHSGYDNTPYFNWIKMYKYPGLIFLGSIISLIAYVPVFLKTKAKNYHFLLVLNLIAFFGMVGVTGSFGSVNLLLSKKVPFFLDLFSYPYQIFGMYFVISFSALVFIGSYMIIDYWDFSSKKKFLFIGLIAILFIGLYGRPVWTGEIMFPRDYNTFKYLPSYLYNVPDDYYRASNFLKKNKLDSKIFSLPYSRTGGVIYLWDLGYSGIDITPRFFGNVVYGANPTALIASNLIIGGKFDKAIFLLAKLNSRYVIFHHDIHPNLFDRSTAYGTENEEGLKNLLVDSEINSQVNNFDIFKVSSSSFLPHFYTSSNNIIVRRYYEKTAEIADESRAIRSAIFVADKNNDVSDLSEKIDSETKAITEKESSDLPVIEFRKINPIKYRIKIHGGNGKFPLIFNESFHEGWKSYLVKSKAPTSPQSSPQAGEAEILNNYKIIDGNEDDQATKEELQGFIESGYVTTLGDGEEKTIEHKKWVDDVEQMDYVEKYSVDFVSKNFQGTIQNDNLPKGHFWETWMAISQKVKSQKSIKLLEWNSNVVELPEESHLMVNGYANSWMIDVNEVCKANSLSSPSSYCVQNPDGSYDFEMVVEFWPQRLFYLGLFISGSTLLACLGYLGYALLNNSKFIVRSREQFARYIFRK